MNPWGPQKTKDQVTHTSPAESYLIIQHMKHELEKWVDVFHFLMVTVVVDSFLPIVGRTQFFRRIQKETWYYLQREVSNCDQFLCV